MDNTTIIIIVVLFIILLSSSSIGGIGYTLSKQPKETSSPTPSTPPPSSTSPEQEKTPSTQQQETPSTQQQETPSTQQQQTPSTQQQQTPAEIIETNITAKSPLLSALLFSFKNATQKEECIQVGDKCVSTWDCNVGDLHVGTTDVSWGEHTESDGTWSCNTYIPECNGNCEAKYNKVQTQEMKKRVDAAAKVKQALTAVLKL
jgi:hypothetical protein